MLLRCCLWISTQTNDERKIRCWQQLQRIRFTIILRQFPWSIEQLQSEDVRIGKRTPIDHSKIKREAGNIEYAVSFLQTGSRWKWASLILINPAEIINNSRYGEAILSSLSNCKSYHWHPFTAEKLNIEKRFALFKMLVIPAVFMKQVLCVNGKPEAANWSITNKSTKIYFDGNLSNRSRDVHTVINLSGATSFQTVEVATGIYRYRFLSGQQMNRSIDALYIQLMDHGVWHWEWSGNRTMIWKTLNATANDEVCTK
jgi:hypothetical protein